MAAKKTKKKAKRKATGRKKATEPTTSRTKLDYGAAMKAAAAGKTARQVAKAAGSESSAKNLSRMGRLIMKRLRTQGQLLERADELGLTVDRMLLSIKRRLDQKRYNRVYWEGGLVTHSETHTAPKRKPPVDATSVDDDVKAQAKAVDQMMQLFGLTKMPRELEDEGPLDDLSDDEMERLYGMLQE